MTSGKILRVLSTVSSKRKTTSPTGSKEISNAKKAKNEKQKTLFGSVVKTPQVAALSVKLNKSCVGNFKISSWNVNGIRSVVKNGQHGYFFEEAADIYCLQETKCSTSDIPTEIELEGYHCFWSEAEKKGYSGTGLLSKVKPIQVTFGLGISEHDSQGRTITAEYETFYLVNTYVPNAGNGLVRLDYRQSWDIDMRNYLVQLASKKDVIYTGDLNVAHKEIDLKNPKGNVKNAGFTIEERNGFTELLNKGFVDTFRHFYPDAVDQYTFWSARQNSRAKNNGWRLDYFVVNESFVGKIRDCIIRSEVYGSDHCPVVLCLDI